MDDRDILKDISFTCEYCGFFGVKKYQKLHKCLSEEEKQQVNDIADKIKFSTGSTRSKEWEAYRFDLMSPYILKADARIFAEGAETHGDRNWEKGQPEEVVLNHVIGHLLSYMEHRVGDNEDHLAKARWGLGALIHYRDCPDYNRPDWEEIA